MGQQGIFQEESAQFRTEVKNRFFKKIKRTQNKRCSDSQNNLLSCYLVFLEP